MPDSVATRFDAADTGAQQNTSSGLQDSGIEAGNIGIQCAGFQRRDKHLSGLRRIDDGVNPKPRRTVARIGLCIVGGLDLVVERLFFRL